MKYFISGEGGTSSLLATLFNPESKQPGQVEFLQVFCKMLKSEGVSLSTDGPPVVKPEYMDMDIVMLWDDWILLLENKISSASITRYQLQKYYKSITEKISKGGFLGIKQDQSNNICIIYLTPTKSIGGAEFNSLHLNEERQDAKIHLSWEVLLHDIEEIFLKGTITDPYVKLVRDGIDLTRQLLNENMKRDPKITATPKRIRMNEFMIDVDERIRDMMRLESTLRLTLWRDNQQDQRYGNLDGNNANVYINLSEEGTSIPEKGTFHLRMGFLGKVAEKAPREYKNKFNEYPASYWSAMLALDKDDLVVDTQKHSASVEVNWSGERSQLIQDAAALFCRFLIMFRPFMGESNTSPAKPAG